jgi:tetratricopeptide (TPR) repeat protein
MQETKQSNLIDTLLNYIPVGLALLMPIFFLPITSEFFEFNKLALLTSATAVMLVVWVVKMITRKQFSITKSGLDFAILVLLVSFTLSSIFSLHQVSSIFGAYGRWFPSLFGIIVLIGFYYVTVTNINTVRAIKMAVLAFLTGSTISTLVALLSYFGVRISDAAYMQSVNFTLTGSSLTASVLAALSVVIALALMLNVTNPAHKAVFVPVMVLNFLGVLLIGTVPAWVAMGVGLLTALYFIPLDKFRANNKYLIVLLGVVITVGLVLAAPSTRKAIVNSDYPREIALSAGESRVISFSVLRDYTLLGTGPSTFYLNFPNYKSLGLNGTDFWNVRFDKPYSEVFVVLSGLGILGILAMGFFLFKVLRLVSVSRFSRLASDENGLYVPLISGIITILVLFIFTYSTVLTGFLFFMFLALIVAYAAVIGESKVSENVHLSVSSNNSMSILGDIGQKTEILPYVVSVPLVGIMMFGMFQFYRMYMGEYYIRQSVNAAAANDGSLTYEMQARAINVNPMRDTYHNAYARTNIALANTLAGKEDLTDAEKATIQTLIAQSIRSARIATEVLNPFNVNNWETRALIYRALSGVATDADQWAIAAYNTAIQLDPTNPRLRLDLGGLYYANEDYLSAANLFRQATSLKPDYANAHYNFAHALWKLNALVDAQREFEFAQSLTMQGTEDYERVSSELAEVRKLVAELGEQTLPTVEQLEGAAPSEEDRQNITQGNQEPLVVAGEEEQISPIDQIEQVGREEETSE